MFVYPPPPTHTDFIGVTERFEPGVYKFCFLIVNMGYHFHSYSQQISGLLTKSSKVVLEEGGLGHLD
jgi:hypothetical protein